MDTIAVLLSIFSTIVALISAYLSQFKKGKVLLLPLRGYRREPSTNHRVCEEGCRLVEIFLNLTFMNTGAVNHAVSDLRLRVPVPEKGEDLLFDWIMEYPTLNSAYDTGKYPAQPTLPPYGSFSTVYSFVSKSEEAQGKLVNTIEANCKENPDKTYTAYIEMRTPCNRWRILRKFQLYHPGTRGVETDYDKINK